MKCEVFEGTIELAVHVSEQLPEFNAPYQKAAYEQRFAGRPNLVLVARVNGRLAGFKVAYEREGYCYSWLGGVLPAFRRQGIASALANTQEKWARSKGYPTITMKTRNRHRNMLHMALKRGFNIIGFEEKAEEGESRIWLRKRLI